MTSRMTYQGRVRSWLGESTTFTKAVGTSVRVVFAHAHGHKDLRIRDLELGLRQVMFSPMTLRHFVQQYSNILKNIRFRKIISIMRVDPYLIRHPTQGLSNRATGSILKFNMQLQTLAIQHRVITYSDMQGISL